MAHNYEYIMLYPEQIKKDPKYQREIDAARIKRILKSWDDDLVNPPKVSLRSNGIYYVFNGQHTLVAWRKRYGNKPILCKVYRDLTEQEEAELFVKQEGIAKAVGIVDKIRVSYNSGNPEVVDMVKCAEKAGCNLVPNAAPSSAKNKINATATAWNVYKTVGSDNFGDILEILRSAFFGDSGAFSDGFMKGMCYLYKHYPDKFTKTKMVEALQKNNIDYYKQQASGKDGSASVRFAKAFADQYNKKKQEKNRIVI